MSDETRLERSTHTVGGDRAQLRLESGTVVVTKTATAQAASSEVEVPLDRVRGVEVRRPTRGSSGWLHLAVVDGSPAPVTELAAMSDPYTIPLTSRQVPAARRLERMVADHVQRRGLPPEAATTRVRAGTSGVTLTDAPPTSTSSARADDLDPVDDASALDASSAPPDRKGEGLTDELRELADLHRSGALTDDEFRRAKQAVLGA